MQNVHSKINNRSIRKITIPGFWNFIMFSCNIYSQIYDNLIFKAYEKLLYQDFKYNVTCLGNFERHSCKYNYIKYDILLYIIFTILFSIFYYFESLSPFYYTKTVFFPTFFNKNYYYISLRVMSEFTTSNFNSSPNSFE